MFPRAVRAVRRALLALAVLSVGGAIWIVVTGGAGTSINGLRVSAYNPWRPLAGATILLALWAALRLVPGGRTSFAAEREWWGRLVPRRPPDPLLFIAVVAAITDVLQWWRAPPLWLDEQMIAINIRDRSFVDLTGTLWLGQSAPLGWLWIQRLVLLVFGTSELVLRLVPLLFGLGTIAAAVWIARRWMSRVAGCVFLVICWLGTILSHYRFELKHYSADVFWALLLPALAMWAMEPEDNRVRLRRQVIWLLAAGAGQWIANGALLVAPGCVVWMLWRHTRQRDPGGALRLAAAGSIWLLFFAGHYMLSLRYTHNNAYLRQHWADRVPPATASVPQKVSWLGDQLPSLARDAGGSTLPALFWIVGTTGLVVAAVRTPGSPYFTTPVTAVILGLVGLVPVYERFSLWVVPSIYVGLAMVLDESVRRVAAAFRGRRNIAALVPAAAATLAVVVTAEISVRGWHSLDNGVPADSNHSMDDRSGVEWLMRQRQAGDAIVTTRLGWPAIWWYGGISPGRYPNGRLPDGSVLYQVSYGADRQRCGLLREALGRHRRAIIYISFPDAGDDFYPVLERELLALGSYAGLRTFTSVTRAAVIRLDQGRPVGTGGSSGAPSARGCVDLEPVKRW